MPLAAAHGRVLARDVAARGRAARLRQLRDGRLRRPVGRGRAATAAAPVRLPVAEDIPAGRTDVVPLAPGTVHRIMTGAPLPAGADVVVPVELTDGGTDVVEIRDSPAAGTHLRRAGEDIAAGDRRAAGRHPAGRRAARAGRRGRARRRCRSAAGRGCWSSPPAASWSRRASRCCPGRSTSRTPLLLVAAVEDAGGEARRLHFVPDDVDQFLTTVRAELAGADLLITSGGVSAGAYEVVKDAFRGLGTVEFAKVAMQPGGPQGAGTVDGVPVVTLPGNPVSSFVSFEVFVRPALRRALGTPRPDRLRVPARLTGPLRSPAGRRQFLRGRFDGGRGLPGRRARLAPGRPPGPRQLPGRRPRGRHRTARRRRGRRRADRGSAPVTRTAADPRRRDRRRPDGRRQREGGHRPGGDRGRPGAGQPRGGRRCCAARGVPKGDAVAVARIAGIAGAKRTPDLVPLCHPIALHGVTVDIEVTDDGGRDHRDRPHRRPHRGGDGGADLGRRRRADDDRHGQGRRPAGRRSPTSGCWRSPAARAGEWAR